jgi:solute carrier family 31 (copper transporter), member 1
VLLNLLLASSQTLVHYTMDSMNGSSSGSAMMTPYLHFTTGDYLYLKTWQPTSTGAIAGACIGLVVLALFERWLAATRATLDLHWHQRSSNFALA